MSLVDKLTNSNIFTLIYILCIFIIYTLLTFLAAFIIFFSPSLDVKAKRKAASSLILICPRCLENEMKLINNYTRKLSGNFFVGGWMYFISYIYSFVEDSVCYYNQWCNFLNCFWAARMQTTRFLRFNCCLIIV